MWLLIISLELIVSLAEGGIDFSCYITPNMEWQYTHDGVRRFICSGPFY